MKCTEDEKYLAQLRQQIRQFSIRFYPSICNFDLIDSFALEKILRITVYNTPSAVCHGTILLDILLSLLVYI